MLCFLLGCPEPLNPIPTPPALEVEVGALPPCAFVEPGFEEWSPGGDWDLQYPEDNPRYLYTGSGVGVADFDGDGWLDVFLPGATRAQLFFGTPTGFEDRSDALIISLDRGVGVSVVDFDGDGDLDLHHTRLGRPDALLRNDGGAFVDVAAEWGVADGRRGISSSWGDMEGDGDLDLFVANFGSQSLDRADGNGLYERTDAGFVDRSELMPADFSEAFTFTGGFMDLDGDGLPELYGVNDFGWKLPNQLLWNRGGVFEADGNLSGLDVAIEGMGLGLNDLNGDGTPDLLMGSWNDVALLQSSGGLWADAADALGIGPDEEAGRVIAWGSALEDLDNDGDLDALLVNGYLRVTEGWPLPAPFDQPESLFINEAGQFTEQSEIWGLADTGASRGFVLADFDRDGALDLIRRDQRGPARLHRGRCAGNAVYVALTQPGPNPDAVGAVVELQTEQGTQRRWMRAGTTNIGSAGPPVVHFGVGVAEQATLRITWPDGRQDSAQVPTQARVRLSR